MWLIARVTTDGRDTVARFARGHTPVGEPRLAEVQALLRPNGYDVTMGTVDRTEWPLLAIAYRSRNRDGVGRLGGQYMTYRVKKICAPPEGATK